MNIWLSFIGAALGSLGFGYMFNIKGNKVFVAAFNGGVGGFVYALGLAHGHSNAVSLFFGSMAVSLLSEIFARYFKCPVTTFLICALIPLVPGGAMYYTMLEVVKGNKKLGISNIYKIKSIRSKAELTYNISFSATYECVKGNISTEELKLYNYMRFLHHKTQRENSKALKGNMFQMNQSEIAKALDVTQGRISQMIDNLLDEKLLSITGCLFTNISVGIINEIPFN